LKEIRAVHCLPGNVRTFELNGDKEAKKTGVFLSLSNSFLSLRYNIATLQPTLGRCYFFAAVSVFTTA
jgi:hypothetical protein